MRTSILLSLVLLSAGATSLQAATEAEFRDVAPVLSRTSDRRMDVRISILLMAARPDRRSEARC